MERMKEQVAEVFTMLEAELAVAKREFEEINARYREIDAAHTKAWERWKAAEEAFAHIDALQGIIEELETSE